MKYKTGDHVVYDNGEWRFYGTVNAVIENSISPCYRITVERMERIKPDYFIMQFEFELEPIDTPSLGNVRKTTAHAPAKTAIAPAPQSAVPAKTATAPAPQLAVPAKTATDPAPQSTIPAKPVAVPTKQPTGMKSKRQDEKWDQISTIWERNLNDFTQGKRNTTIANWIRGNRVHFANGSLPDEKLKRLTEINFPFIAIQRNKKVATSANSFVATSEKTEYAAQQKPDSEKAEHTTQPQPDNEKPVERKWKWWEQNLQAYTRGETSEKVNNWIFYNRKNYEQGILSDERLQKLQAANFSFEEVVPEKNPKTPRPVWDQNLQAYLQGESSEKIDSWVQKNMANYENNTLPPDKLNKLKEINFPFEVPTAEPAKTETKKEALPPAIRRWYINLQDYAKGVRNTELKHWAATNKSRYKKGALSKDQLESLRSIKFSFTGRTVRKPRELSQDAVWENNLQNYIRGKRDEMVSEWIQTNRKEYMLNTLPDKKLEKLIEIDFPFDIDSPATEIKKEEEIPVWERNLIDYTNGEKSLTLNTWVYQNRKQYHAGKLSPEKVEKLRRINFSFDQHRKGLKRK